MPLIPPETVHCGIPELFHAQEVNYRIKHGIGGRTYDIANAPAIVIQYYGLAYRELIVYVQHPDNEDRNIQYDVSKRNDDYCNCSV